VRIYFITQNPLDIPEDVLGQLGLKVQHALRAFTPKDQKSIKAVGDSFVANPDFKTADAVTSLGIGEALFKSAARAIGSQLGRQIIRGVLGSIFGGRRK
jgi:DNA helicase HerA-like ATPase